ncbi:Asp23/Gls24 family envelope stress response protein [Pseudonocardia sp. HH130630-07]|uniref:Asp23/Gls24 family envelope stress response protein n=1 Tax=Pseudonocardia sp. HH130630-07 TaxID=1690815 RepID=UPI000814C103|nr:Asp23/Gls24 family envelope stress response protein [Pseudonocardia sp. HH130630-07]ANY06961.1 stress protein, Gls24 family [Pseudonocardia sp. HH130630-07]
MSTTPEAKAPISPAAPSALQSEFGSTRIAETVVSKIAGLAAREVNGIHALGGGAARAFGALRERIPGGTTNASQGVAVEVGEKQAAVDINVVVEYGVSIADLAKAVRRNVITALERMTGLEVVEVNISVDDVHLPTEEDAEPREPAPRKIENPGRVS